MTVGRKKFPLTGRGFPESNMKADLTRGNVLPPILQPLKLLLSLQPGSCFSNFWISNVCVLGTVVSGETYQLGSNPSCFPQTLSFYFPPCGKIPPPVIMVQNVSFKYSENTVSIMHLYFPLLLKYGFIWHT